MKNKYLELTSYCHQTIYSHVSLNSHNIAKSLTYELENFLYTKGRIFKIITFFVIKEQFAAPYQIRIPRFGHIDCLKKYFMCGVKKSKLCIC